MARVKIAKLERSKELIVKLHSFFKQISVRGARDQGTNLKAKKLEDQLKVARMGYIELYVKGGKMHRGRACAFDLEADQLELESEGGTFVFPREDVVRVQISLEGE